MPRGIRAEVLADEPERVEHLDLVHDVEVAPPLPQQEVDVGERLEPGAELRGGAADALGDGAHLAVALGEEDDDAVGLAQAVGAQDDAPVAEEAHRSVRRCWRGRVEWAVALAAPFCLGHGAAGSRAPRRPPGHGPPGRAACGPGRRRRANGGRRAGCPHRSARPGSARPRRTSAGECDTRSRRGRRTRARISDPGDQGDPRWRVGRSPPVFAGRPGGRGPGSGVDGAEPAHPRWKSITAS